MRWLLLALLIFSFKLSEDGEPVFCWARSHHPISRTCDIAHYAEV